MAINNSDVELFERQLLADEENGGSRGSRMTVKAFLLYPKRLMKPRC